MTMSDPIADMLTRIRNAISVRHREVLVPHSKAKLAIVEILRDEGFIEEFQVTGDRPQAMIRIRLKYDEEGEPLLLGLERISKPGRRVFAGKDELPWVLEGLGVAVVSTPRGVMTARRARRLKVGGEVWCHIW
jgi:small subunit ribosomal protein S8